MTNATQSRTPAIAVRCILAEGGAGDDHIILTPAGGEPLTIWVSTLTADVQRYAALHGLKQKLVDAAAISRDPETGRSATVADKLRAVQDVLDRLLAGEWNKRREGGGSVGGLLLRALVRMGADREATIERLAKLTDAEKAALRANPKVAAIIAEIKAEEATDDEIDTDAMLGDLLG